MPKTNTKSPPQTTTTLITNNNSSRSKINLAKKRPISRNNTQLALTKTSTANNHHHKNTKNKRKGAFKGALDADPEDEPQAQKKEDQVWVSEPSTRCTTPCNHEQQNNTTPIRLELQLPNPLPLSQPSSPPPDHHQPIMVASSSKIEEAPETRGRSKSRHRTPTHQPRQVSLTPAPAIPNSSEHLPQPSTPSPTLLPNKGKAKASSPSSSKPPRAKRTSINSVRSLSSLVILHNDAHLKTSNTTRLALKRVESTASIVLPPKIDTTEAVITLNGKAAFNPTLMSISDFPSEISPASPLPNTATSSPVATTSKNCTIPYSPPPSSQPAEQPKLPSPPSAHLEQSECALRLKKYSNNATRPRQLVNLRAANEAPSGLISSLLSPGLTFKSRRSDPHHGAGYFDSFKSLVGISSLAEQVTEEEGHSKAEPDRSSTLPSRSSPRPVHGSTGTVSQSKKDGTPGVSLNGVRYPFAQSHKLLGHARPAQPKPAIPGMMTTCGPVPVQSKFLGPRPAPPPATTTSSAEPSTSSTPVRSDGTRSAAASHDVVVATKKASDQPTTVGGCQLHGPEGGRTLSRIQKKLLMERDRPISPTLLNHPSPPSPAGPPCSSSTDTDAVTTLAPPAATTLPPPSYLIRSLGGQIGPLPFIPLDLLPPDTTLPPASSSTTTTTNTSSHQHDPSSSSTAPTPEHLPPRLNQPALKAKQALSIKLWRNSLIDEVEQVLTDHESNTRFRNPLFESLLRVSNPHSL